MEKVNNPPGTQEIPTVEQRKALLAEALASRKPSGSARQSRGSTRLRLDAQSLLDSLQQTVSSRSHQTVEQANNCVQVEQGSMCALTPALTPDSISAFDQPRESTADPIQAQPTQRDNAHPHGDQQEITALDQRLRELASSADTTAAALLEALARFDELQGWRASGAPHCVGWMNLQLGISASLAREKLRVARTLRQLPLIRQLFAQGELSWSKVRAMSRVATPATEQGLCIVALEVPVNTLVQLCENLRWRDPTADLDDAARDKLRHERRSLSWSDMPDGSTQFRLVLPPEMAANFRRCLERAEDLLFATDETGQYSASRAAQDPKAEGVAEEPATSPQANRISATQRRADAAVAMAESSLAAEGIGLSSADRYQVVVHLDAEVLDSALTSVVETADSGNAVNRATHADTAQQLNTSTHADAAEHSHTSPNVKADVSTESRIHGATKQNSQTTVPGSPDSPQPHIALPQAVRIALQGGRGLSVPGVRRMICDASLVTLIESNGTPISIGQKGRVWPEPMRRACLIRDGNTCTFPGCSSSRWLDVHHMIHWLDGGETSMENGVSLCRSCHTRVHDEGWMIERLPSTPQSRSKHQCGTLAEALTHDADEETLALVQTLKSQVPRYRFYLPATDKRVVKPDTSSVIHDCDQNHDGYHDHDRDHDGFDCCAETQAHYAENIHYPGAKTVSGFTMGWGGILTVPDSDRQSPEQLVEALFRLNNNTRVATSTT